MGEASQEVGVMPKEYIEDRYTGHDDDAVAEGSTAKVRVGWSREQEHVEIATVAPDEIKLEPTPEGNGWFVQLDRSGLNRLIRSLRKARDQAYGADA
jgi:hypothetical protein